MALRYMAIDSSIRPVARNTVRKIAICLNGAGRSAIDLSKRFSRFVPFLQRSLRYSKTLPSFDIIGLDGSAERKK